MAEEEEKKKRSEKFRENMIKSRMREGTTRDQAVAEVDKDLDKITNTLLARIACSMDAEAKKLKKGNGGNGEITCPICKTGKLEYSVASLNGHMAARCSTQGCVRWIE